MATHHHLRHEEFNELQDGPLWVTLLGGVGIGVAVAFVLAFILASFAAPWPGTLLIAAWGGVVAGPFVGIQITLATKASHEEAVEEAAHPTTPAKPAPPAAPTITGRPATV
jgi:hypothetical protein